MNATGLTEAAVMEGAKRSTMREPRDLDRGRQSDRVLLVGAPSDQHHVLPPTYLGGFAIPAPSRSDGSIWIFRPPIGQWQQALLADTAETNRHFNALPGAPRGTLEMERALATADASAVPRLVEAAESRRPLTAELRQAGARFLALMGVLRAPGLGDLPEVELQVGVASMESALREMGWVFWVTDAPDYFITSSAPLQVVFPKGDEGWIEEMDLHSPGTEITCPLTPRIAIHATWKRSGELWRRAGEDALMEVNGRTSLRARQFLAAPRPAIPG